MTGSVRAFRKNRSCLLCSSTTPIQSDIKACSSPSSASYHHHIKSNENKNTRIEKLERVFIVGDHRVVALQAPDCYFKHFFCWCVRRGRRGRWAAKGGVGVGVRMCGGEFRGRWRGGGTGNHLTLSTLWARHWTQSHKNIFNISYPALEFELSDWLKRSHGIKQPLKILKFLPWVNYWIATS